MNYNRRGKSHKIIQSISSVNSGFNKETFRLRTNLDQLRGSYFDNETIFQTKSGIKKFLKLSY